MKKKQKFFRKLFLRLKIWVIYFQILFLNSLANEFICLYDINKSNVFLFIQFNPTIYYYYKKNLEFLKTNSNLKTHKI